MLSQTDRQGQELHDDHEMTTCIVALCTRVEEETGVPDTDNDKDSDVTNPGDGMNEEVKSFLSIPTLIYIIRQHQHLLS